MTWPFVQGVLGLASAFYRNAIAEGVETAAHGKMLLLLGCELAQGYGIARPMAAHELPGWAATWRPDQAWRNLSSVSSDNLSILHAIVEHRSWITAIEDYIKGKRDVPPPLDPKQCRFGIRLDSECLAGHVDQSDLENIGAIHSRIHIRATEICELHSGGRTIETLAMLDELCSMRDALIEQLETLAQESRQ